jgi:hypothetical protein
MMNLFDSMKMHRNGGASYGTVPGNGDPKADDKIMNVGPGHVVPAENAHIAKKLLAILGYDPNAKVDMNQGNGQGVDIRISSKEVFLNDKQVDEIEAMGIDAEGLSPNSPYNQRVKGGTTKQVEDMVNDKLSMYDLMMNNNNQYPAYQDAGSTNQFQPYERPDLSPYPYFQVVEGVDGGEPSAEWYDELGRRVYSEIGSTGHTSDFTKSTPEDWAYFTEQGYTPELDINNLPAGLERNPEYNPSGFTYDLPTRPSESSIPPVSERKPIGLQAPSSKEPTMLDESNPAKDAQGEQTTKESTDEGLEKEQGLTPEEKYIQDLTDRNKKLTDAETATNAGMALWNWSRSPEDLPPPVTPGRREIVRPYERMISQGKQRTASMTAGMMKKMRETGQMHLMPGISASLMEADQKQQSQIWDLMAKDTMMNVAAENQRQQFMADALTKHGYAKAKHLTDFAREKGKAVGDNIAQMYDVQDESLKTDAKLKGYQVDIDEANLDDEYNRLDVKAIKAAKGKDYRLTREQYYRLPRKEQEALLGMHS